MRQTPTRRQVITGAAQATALGALGMLSAGRADETKTTPSRLNVGIATFRFTDHSNASLAKELSSGGIRLVQLFLSQTDSKFWVYNGRSDLSSLTPARSREIAAIYRDAGITIHSLGVYTNLIHPDAAERQANLDYFEAMMDVGAEMGVNTFITEAGHYHDLKAPAPRVAHHFQPEVWTQMVGTGRRLAALAEQHQAKVLFEGYFMGFLASAKRLRLYLEEIDSPHVRALLDPANLVELNDLEEMFNQLGPWIDCLHAKDRKLHVERGVAAGQGDVDYVKFVTLAARHTPAAPLILEYVDSKDYRTALAHLRGALEQAGIEEG